MLGYFDLEKRAYRHIEIHEQVEVLSLIGNFALHIVVGKSDGTADGGHLLKAGCSPRSKC